MRRHTVHFRCCSKDRRGVKRIREMYFICIRDFWSARQGFPIRLAAVRSRHCPIIETQAGDVSAYIPTNVISITDGQIYLETELFNAGIRPAINAGLSVSRVGGSAQIKAMKKIAAPIRVELAQYRELASFAQFASELDAATKEKLAQGERIREVLKQPQYQPMPVEKQIVILYAATKKYLLEIPVHEILPFEEALFAEIDTNAPEILSAIREKKQLDEETEKKLVERILVCRAAFQERDGKNR